MEHGWWAGLVLALVAGAIGGSTLTPMKYVKHWPWENVWLIYATCAYFVTPWIMGLATVPHLFEVYRHSGLHVCFFTALIGMGWGFAVVFCGLAVDMAGLSISTVLLYGVSVALGSLGALFIIDASKLRTAEGLRICLWNVIVLAGVYVCFTATRAREKSSSVNRKRLRLGIVLSLLAGVLSTLFNIALAFGEPIRMQAIAAGATSAFAANAVWSLAVSAGSIPSLTWAVYLLSVNSTWSTYRQQFSLRNVSLCVAMAVIWITGTVLYGSAAAHLGNLGAAIGWPVFMCSIIITGNGWGWFLGEWRSAPPQSRSLLWAGMGVQMLGIVLLSTIH